ncbi:DUF3795 domain-containing protein [Desulfovibrio sp. JY]|nr:DUF3795 domain-containing protein [Desulfovibrio sp. JY]
MDKKLVCPCGLTCCDCMFYKDEIYDAALKLKNLIVDSRLDFFLKACSDEKTLAAMGEHLDLGRGSTQIELSEKYGIFKEIPTFMNVLEGIIKIQCKTPCRESRGCSAGGDTIKCTALKCLESKKYDGCWQCGEYEDCEKLKFLKMSYGFVINENLTTIKEEGEEKVRSHGSQYYAWQRKLSSTR